MSVPIFLQQLIEKIGIIVTPILGRNDRMTERNRQKTAHFHAILCSHIRQSGRDTHPRCRPVAVNIQIRPHTKVVALEAIARKRFPGARWIVQRSPQTHLPFTMKPCLYDIVSIRFANAFTGLDTRGVKLIVYPRYSLQWLSLLPTFESIHPFKEVHRLDVHRMRRTTLRRRTQRESRERKSQQSRFCFHTQKGS